MQQGNSTKAKEPSYLMEFIMINVISANASITSTDPESPFKGEVDFTTLDLRTHAPAVRNPENVGVWQNTLIKHPEFLTLKAKLRIMDNLLNQRHPLSNMGRCPESAIRAYQEDKLNQARRSQGV